VNSVDPLCRAWCLFLIKPPMDPPHHTFLEANSGRRTRIWVSGRKRYSSDRRTLDEALRQETCSFQSCLVVGWNPSLSYSLFSLQMHRRSNARNNAIFQTTWSRQTLGLYAVMYHYPDAHKILLDALISMQTPMYGKMLEENQNLSKPIICWSTSDFIHSVLSTSRRLQSYPRVFNEGW
jgi:hypothetical protein